jgi:hypothetical protein
MMEEEDARCTTLLLWEDIHGVYIGDLKAYRRIRKTITDPFLFSVFERRKTSSTHFLGLVSRVLG